MNNEFTQEWTLQWDHVCHRENYEYIWGEWGKGKLLKAKWEWLPSFGAIVRGYEDCWQRSHQSETGQHQYLCISKCKFAMEVLLLISLCLCVAVLGSNPDLCVLVRCSVTELLPVSLAKSSVLVLVTRQLSKRTLPWPSQLHLAGLPQRLHVDLQPAHMWGKCNYFLILINIILFLVDENTRSPKEIQTSQVSGLFGGDTGLAQPLLLPSSCFPTFYCLNAQEALAPLLLPFGVWLKTKYGPRYHKCFQYTFIAKPQAREL